MSQRKFDFECIYFTNELISELIDEGVLQKNNILPEQLRYIILQLVQNNYELDGKLTLSKEQMLKAMHKAHKLSTDYVIEEMIKEGVIEYDGITPNGDYTFQYTEKGKELEKDTTESKIIEIIKKLREESGNSQNPGS